MVRSTVRFGFSHRPQPLNRPEYNSGCMGLWMNKSQMDEDIKFWLLAFIKGIVPLLNSTVWGSVMWPGQAYWVKTSNSYVRFITPEYSAYKIDPVYACLLILLGNVSISLHIFTLDQWSCVFRIDLTQWEGLWRYSVCLGPWYAYVCLRIQKRVKNSMFRGAPYSAKIISRFPWTTHIEILSDSQAYTMLSLCEAILELRRCGRRGTTERHNGRLWKMNWWSTPRLQTLYRCYDTCYR